MIYVTGDCHGDFRKFTTSAFPEQREMTKDDIVIICGDFGGVWDGPIESSNDAYWLNWLDQKPFTTVFADGNHENFDRLYNDYEIVDFCSGKAHKIRESVYHLMRGEIFLFDGLKFFVFGGASSHDAEDGILSREDFDSDKAFTNEIKRWHKQKKRFRIKGWSWWEQELPSDEEYQNAENNLAKAEYKVDYVITHCAPEKIAQSLGIKDYVPDRLTLFFDELRKKLEFRYWFFGHYHNDLIIDKKYVLLYDQLVKAAPSGKKDV